LLERPRVMKTCLGFHSDGTLKTQFFRRLYTFLALAVTRFPSFLVAVPRNFLHTKLFTHDTANSARGTATSNWASGFRKSSIKKNSRNVPQESFPGLGFTLSSDLDLTCVFLEILCVSLYMSHQTLSCRTVWHIVSTLGKPLVGSRRMFWTCRPCWMSSERWTPYCWYLIGGSPALCWITSCGDSIRTGSRRSYPENQQ
jgi:hypothetical protein